MKDYPEQETFIYEGMSPELKEIREAGMKSMVAYPDHMLISDRDHRNPATVDFKTKQQKKYMKMRMDEIAESLEKDDTGRTCAGIYFPKGEPVTVKATDFPFDQRKARFHKLHTLVDHGTLKLVKEKAPEKAPEKKKTSFSSKG